jgi:hypothetical protein
VSEFVMSVTTVGRGITVPCPCGEVYVLRPAVVAWLFL